jgi:sulfonate transport system substrate-binding protein
VKVLRQFITVLLLLPTAMPAAAQNMGTVRFAWQPIGTIQGHVGTTFERTDVLALNNVRCEMTSFTTGGAPMNEGLVAAQFDVLTYGEGPALAAMSRGIPLKLVAKSNYYKIGMLVSAKSPIKQVSELKGKRVAVAFGSGAHRSAIEMLRGAALEPGRDVDLVNLDPGDGATALSSGEIDAWVIWDPGFTDLLQKGLAKVLSEAPPKSNFNVTVMTQGFVTRKPRDAIDFLKAQQEALWFSVNHKQQTSEWMAKLVPISLSAILKASEYDQNWNAKSLMDVDLSFSDEDVAVMQKEAQFLFDNKLLPMPISIKDHLDPSVYQRARAELQQITDKTPITVLKP